MLPWRPDDDPAFVSAADQQFDEVEGGRVVDVSL